MAREITRRIIMLQEERIRMQGDDERSYLLTVAHDADTGDLEELHATNAHVLVRFMGESGLDSGVAHSVRRLQ